jgi:hypothetical protein
VKKIDINNINIKIILIVFSFYSTIIQDLFKIYYITIIILILIFVITYKEILQNLIFFKNDYIFLAPLFFLFYIVIQFFYYTSNLNYNAIYITSSFLFLFILFLFSKKKFYIKFL